GHSDGGDFQHKLRRPATMRAVDCGTHAFRGEFNVSPAIAAGAFQEFGFRHWDHYAAGAAVSSTVGSKRLAQASRPFGRRNLQQHEFAQDRMGILRNGSETKSSPDSS